MAKKNRIPTKLAPWIEARRRFHLSHAHVQMARELGLNPKKLGGCASNRDEPWKLPLPEFIAELYFKSFGRRSPERILSVEDLSRELERKKAAKRQAKAARREAGPGRADDPAPGSVT